MGTIKVFVFFVFVIFSLIPTNDSVPTKCSKNEEYLSCGSPCQTECDTLGQKCRIVNIRCPDGCFCKPGYARIESGGECVPQEECPASPCPTNEVWLERYQAPECQTECSNMDNLCSIRIDHQSEGCFCKEGYARHPDTHLCIPQDECPPVKPECGANEEYIFCASVCDNRCDNLGQNCSLAVSSSEDCIEDCYCKSGYARDSEENCISQELCPNPFCPENEVWLSCGQASACQTKCPKWEPCYIKPASCPQGCYCKNDYGRHPTSNECVPFTQCPTSSAESYS